jgi:hypothetical protein
VEEYFLEFFNVHDTSRNDLFDKHINALEKHKLEVNNIKGQGYVNDSNMKGKYQGVQKRLLDINGRAFYTICGCHY